MLERIACPGSRADSAVKTRYAVLCGLALATSQPWAQHNAGPGYSCAGSSFAPAVARTITGPRPQARRRPPVAALAERAHATPGSVFTRSAEACTGTASRGRGAPAGTRAAG